MRELQLLGLLALAALSQLLPGHWPELALCLLALVAWRQRFGLVPRISYTQGIACGNSHFASNADASANAVTNESPTEKPFAFATTTAFALVRKAFFSKLLGHVCLGGLMAVIAYSFVGVGYAADWLHFTAGPARFDLGWQLCIAVAWLLITAILGSELLLRGILMRAWLEWFGAPRAATFGALATAFVALPIIFGDDVSRPLRLELMASSAAWGFTLSILYALTHSVPACGTAAALYRFFAQYGVCDIELSCDPIGYYVTSLTAVRWLGVVFALLPGIVGAIGLWRRSRRR